MSEPVDQAEAERHRAKMAKRKAVQDAEVAGKTIEKGLLIVHTGAGKGKSTAAFGLALRMLGRGERLFQSRGLLFDIRLGEHEIRQPQRQAIDQNRPVAAGRKRFGEFPRRLNRAPSRAAALAMALDARRHLFVAHLGGGDISPGRRRSGNQAFRMAAFARTGAAKNQCELRNAGHEEQDAQLAGQIDRPGR